MPVTLGTAAKGHMITEADAPTRDLRRAQAGVRCRRHRILNPSLSGAVVVGAFLFAVLSG
jgi:hypothetical protein